MKLYVASSWQNTSQPSIVRHLREAGHDVYDFRDPGGDGSDAGFHWSEIDPEWKSWTPEEFAKALDHDLARAGYAKDWAAMERADACILVMPCGRSAHLEAGYFVGAGKALWILLDNGEPELMYRMATGLFSWWPSLLDAVAASAAAAEAGGSS